MISMRDAALSQGAVLVWQAPVEKEAALRQLLDVCCADIPEHKESAWVSVIERELQGGTFVGQDVAIPHARMVGLKAPRVALGVGAAGIQDREAGRSVRILWLLLSPAEPPESHVRMLGAISRLASDDQWRRQVLSAKTPAEVRAALRSSLSH